jgi:hypothetical protein
VRVRLVDGVCACPCRVKKKSGRSSLVVGAVRVRFVGFDCRGILCARVSFVRSLVFKKCASLRILDVFRSFRKCGSVFRKCASRLGILCACVSFVRSFSKVCEWCCCKSWSKSLENFVFGAAIGVIAGAAKKLMCVFVCGLLRCSSSISPPCWEGKGGGRKCFLFFFFGEGFLSSLSFFFFFFFFFFFL